MNVSVVSHRRSGTHLTIDLIRNNFPAYARPYISAREIHIRTQDSTFLRQVAQEAMKYPHVIKSHHVGVPDKFFGVSAGGSLVSELIESSRLIYVYRDPRDVLVSLYFHLRAEGLIEVDQDVWHFITDINAYYNHTYRGEKSRIEYWLYHLESWLGRHDILLLSFEFILQEYLESVEKIGEFLNTERSRKLSDVRWLPRPNSEAKWISSVNFRQGLWGEFRKHLDRTKIAQFEAMTQPMLKRLGYR